MPKGRINARIRGHDLALKEQKQEEAWLILHPEGTQCFQTSADESRFADANMQMYITFQESDIYLYREYSNKKKTYIRFRFHLGHYQRVGFVSVLQAICSEKGACLDHAVHKLKCVIYS